MAKVYARDDANLFGFRKWVESIGINIAGRKIHTLFYVDVWHFPERADIVMAEGKRENKEFAIHMLMDKYGEYFVVWDEKPTEPYFKDGWPEWEII